MRLLYFHQHFSTPNGAAGIRSYQMARELIRRGHRVTMVCGSHKLGVSGLTAPFEKGRRRGTVDGIDVIEFNLSYSNRDNLLKRSWTFASFALGSIGVALRESYDLAFATTTPLTVAIPVLAARAARGKKYVFEVRDLWPELPREMGIITNPVVLALLSLLEFLAYRGAERCIALSPGIVDGIARHGIDKRLIAMIPNGCDSDVFSHAVVPWRPKGIDQSKLLAVFAGAHGPANGLKAVLDAAVELRDRNRTDIAVALVGDGKEKDALVEFARRERLDMIHFLDPVPKPDLVGLLAGADVGLQILADVPAFYYGTSPNKFFDYLAAGKPVLTNYPGWVADLITEHGAGVAVRPGSPGSLADALIDLAEDRVALRSMGAAALRLAESRFDRGRLAAQWADQLLSATERRK